MEDEIKIPDDGSGVVETPVVEPEAPVEAPVEEPKAE